MTFKVVRIPNTLKKKPDRLPWPRLSSDLPQVPLGIDVKQKQQDIIKLVHKFFKVEGMSMDELLQEVYTAIIHKNHTRSAHDPRKSSFGHYVYMVANNVCINLVHKKNKFSKERESLDSSIGEDDNRSVIDTIEVCSSCDDMIGHIKQIEDILRQNRMWELARYVHTVSSGASSDRIREAISFGGKSFSNKMIRDIRTQIKKVVTSLSD